jgi:ribosomal protein S12 methylthiotransferase
MYFNGEPEQRPAICGAVTAVTFVERGRFDHVGVFTYSHEDGTPAGRFEDDVPGHEKERRRRRVMGIQRRRVESANRAKVGQRVRILVDGPSPEHELVLRGRLEGQAPEIDSVVYLSEIDPSTCQAGDLVDAEVVEARGYDLVARPLLT